MSLSLVNESAKVLAEIHKKDERFRVEDAQILEQMKNLSDGINAYRQTYEKCKKMLNGNYTLQLSEMNKKIYGTN